MATDCDQGSQQLPILPPELIVEILSRVPVKFLLRFRCVCKSWKSLISDPQFAKLHLRMLTADPRSTRQHIMFCFSEPGFTIRTCSVDSICNGLATSAVEMKYPLKNPSRFDFIAGSCNGLLCFAVKQSYVLIWNPSIGVFKKSPHLGNQGRVGSFTVYGFGYDHLIDNYKVVAVFCCGIDGRGAYKTEVKVYTLGANSWRRIQDFPSGFPYDEKGRFVNGTLNWVGANVSHSPSVLISLDLGKETYVELPQPDYEGVVITLNLGVLRDCLCILSYHRTHSDVWIMKDFGVKGSWTKLLKQLTLPYLEYPPLVLYTKEPCISESSEILLQDRISLYNSKTTSIVESEIQNGSVWLDAEIYIESLISPCF